jgi:hypothetical protein
MTPIVRLIVLSSVLGAACAKAVEVPPGMGVLLTERGELIAAATVPTLATEAVTGGDGILALPGSSAVAMRASMPASAEMPAESAAVRLEPLDIPMPPRVIAEAYVPPSAPVEASKPKPAVQSLASRRANALRPDSSGVIVLARNTSASAVDEARQTRNPWGVRVAARDSMVEYKLSLDGVVFGQRGGTALINGVPVRVGERLIGPFVLAELDPRGEVVMEYDGTFFRLSEGRPAEVRIPKF